MNKKIAIFGSSKFETIEYHIADSLRHLGYEVTVFDYDSASGIQKKISYWRRRFREDYSAKVCKKIAKQVIGFQPDLVIGTYRDIHPVFVDTVKAELPAVKCIHINPDAITTFQKQQIFASNYDHYFTKDAFIVRFMRDKMGLDTYLLPESFNPRVHTKPQISKELAEKETGIDVLVFGGMYPYRTRMIEKLVDAGLKVEMFGSKGPNFPKKLEPFFNNKKIYGEEKSKLLYGAKVVFNNFHYAEIEGVNCKFFEINGIGAFQICDYIAGMESFLNYDANKTTFKSIDEAVKLIKEFLKPENDELRWEIANKNYEHFLLHHTYEHRLKEVFEIIGF